MLDARWALLLLLLSFSSARALTPDGVGAEEDLPDYSCQLMEVIGGATLKPLFICSGTRISNDRILTAGHCRDMAEYAFQAEHSSFLTYSWRYSCKKHPRWDVASDWDILPSTQLVTQHGRNGKAPSSDVAVLFTRKDSAAPAVQLAEDDAEIDRLKSAGGCRAVGFGFNQVRESAGDPKYPGSFNVGSVGFYDSPEAAIETLDPLYQSASPVLSLLVLEAAQWIRHASGLLLINPHIPHVPGRARTLRIENGDSGGAVICPTGNGDWAQIGVLTQISEAPMDLYVNNKDGKFSIDGHMIEVMATAVPTSRITNWLRAVQYPKNVIRFSDRTKEGQ